MIFWPKKKGGSWLKLVEIVVFPCMFFSICGFPQPRGRQILRADVAAVWGAQWRKAEMIREEAGICKCSMASQMYHAIYATITVHDCTNYMSYLFRFVVDMNCKFCTWRKHIIISCLNFQAVGSLCWHSPFTLRWVGMKPRDTALLLKVGEPNRSPQISSRSQVAVAVGVFDARSLSYATGCLVASFVAKLGESSRFQSCLNCVM